MRRWISRITCLQRLTSNKDCRSASACLDDYESFCAREVTGCCGIARELLKCLRRTAALEALDTVTFVQRDVPVFQPVRRFVMSRPPRDPRVRIRTRFDLMFQFYKLIPRITARENLTLVTAVVTHLMPPEEAR